MRQTAPPGSTPPADAVGVDPVAGRQTSPAAGRRAEDEYAHCGPLLVEFAALTPGDRRRRRLRDELATEYWPVVVHIASRYRDRGEPVADLQQVGAVGLLGALERFDPGRGVDFLGFAVPTITGEIRRHFRDRTWSVQVPRSLKDLQTPIRDAAVELIASLQRAPRPSEIAAHLGIEVGQVVDALVAHRAHSPGSLDEPVTAGGSRAAVGDLFGTVDAALAVVGYRGDLRRALAELPERDRCILVLRFFGDLTQSQIAEQVGLSQMHVSRILNRTLTALRTRIDAPGRPAPQ